MVKLLETEFIKAWVPPNGLVSHWVLSHSCLYLCRRWLSTRRKQWLQIQSHCGGWARGALQRDSSVPPPALSLIWRQPMISLLFQAVQLLGWCLRLEVPNPAMGLPILEVHIDRIMPCVCHSEDFFHFVCFWDSSIILYLSIICSFEMYLFVHFSSILMLMDCSQAVGRVKNACNEYFA